MDLGNFGWVYNRDSAPNHSSYDQGMAVNSFLLYRLCQLRGIKIDFEEGRGTNHIPITLHKSIMHLTVEYCGQLWSFTSQRMYKFGKKLYSPG